MNPIALDGPAVEPISLADMKAYLRLDGDDEDDLVSALITAGRLTVERTARIALLAQTWRIRLPGWPRGRAVALPLRPFISVESVRAAASASGSPELVPPELYRVDLSDETPRLLVDAAVPDPPPRSAGIWIDVSCGYGASPAAVPEPLVLAIRRLVAFWFERRGDEPPRRAPALPADVAALLAPFGRPRLA